MQQHSRVRGRFDRDPGRRGLVREVVPASHHARRPTAATANISIDIDSMKKVDQDVKQAEKFIDDEAKKVQKITPPAIARRFAVQPRGAGEGLGQGPEVPPPEPGRPVASDLVNRFASNFTAENARECRGMATALVISLRLFCVYGETH